MYVRWVSLAVLNMPKPLCCVLFCCSVLVFWTRKTRTPASLTLRWTCQLILQVFCSVSVWNQRVCERISVYSTALTSSHGWEIIQMDGNQSMSRWTRALRFVFTVVNVTDEPERSISLDTGYSVIYSDVVCSLTQQWHCDRELIRPESASSSYAHLLLSGMMRCFIIAERVYPWQIVSFWISHIGRRCCVDMS